MTKQPCRKALCAGDPRIKEKIELVNDVARLHMLKSEHSSQHYHVEASSLKTFTQQIATYTEQKNNAMTLQLSTERQA
ncbi:MAG: hypothetical protein LBM98_13355 [Oscillospiraceae bacterium]|nr:hypothetical protein [Oscillospiraceae bacterium]